MNLPAILVTFALFALAVFLLVVAGWLMFGQVWLFGTIAAFTGFYLLLEIPHIVTR